ncbi:sensor domain-containing diguanylate cyclase [Gayadomonas joobiniege]|uniref:sensor domain-containing diguanylate cyclase n=1 Tax=Gayadomonas joobiniege TaxID=1234606 RepID=UPI00035EE09A|nr:sensor domain-containing diguanylate cyclase [Gayadomonas joobiniege]
MSDQFKQVHSLMTLLQNVDVGLVVLDREYNIQLWNNFMESHSGLHPADVKDKCLFDVFDEIPKSWFKQKAESVFTLNTRAFTTWEQRPYLFKFKNYRPITGTAEFMYQNSTLIPLKSSAGEVDCVGLIIYDVTDVAVHRQALKAVNNQLTILSRIDKMTGLFNRGYWQERFYLEFKRLQRQPDACSLILFDIDHFKKINDSYGHSAGDLVIKNTADCIRDCIRETDIAGRFGGEEFSLLLFNADKQQAKILAERLLDVIRQQVIRYQGEQIKYTVSIGIAEYSQHYTSAEIWLELADKALYQSKHQGRDCINLAD